MFRNMSLVTNIGLGKMVSFMFGIISFIFLPESGRLLCLGILLWYNYLLPNA